MPKRNVLVLDHHGLGNVVMSLPLLRSLCDPRSGLGEISVLLRAPQTYDLIARENLPIRPLYWLPEHSGVVGLLRFLANERGRHDVIVGVPQVRAAHVALFKALLGASESVAECFPKLDRFLTHPVRKTWTRPILETQREIAGRLRVAYDDRPPSIAVGAEEDAWAESVLRERGVADAEPIVGLHAGASQLSKTWPAENWGETLSALREKFPGMGVVSFGGASEAADAARARAAVPVAPWIDGCGRWGLRQTLALLRRCDLLLSGDTGLMHMAAAVGTRTVSVFGPTSIERLAPLYNEGRAICPAKSCSPCYRDSYAACHCIAEIRVESVLPAALAAARVARKVRRVR